MNLEGTFCNHLADFLEIDPKYVSANTTDSE
jgi:hypothetical protein